MSSVIKLSRSTVEKFITCPRCCVLEKKFKIRPPSLPFTLNIAVDNLCKNEFDYYRRLKKPHPLFLENNIDAIPFQHEKLEEWRSNFKGIRYISKEKNYNFGGAIDDVWQKSNGQLIVADVKATSKNTFDWAETFNNYEYPKAYKRQLEMYQWLLQRNGFKVAKEAYLVYFNGQKNKEFFDNKLNFDTYLIKINCSTDWVERKIEETVSLLKSDSFPKPSPNCEICTYLRKRWNLSQTLK